MEKQPIPFKDIPGRTMRALGFLSRIPVPARYFEDRDAPDETMPRDSFAYPLAGVLIALGPALLLLLLAALRVPDFMLACFTILAVTGVSGALHEDGLGDVADGFGGGRTREDRLAIMKDSRIGTYGAIAIAGALLLRVAGLASIIASGGAIAGALAVIAVAACSRAAIVWFWAGLPNARADGVAAQMGSPGENAVGTAAVTGLAIFAVLGMIAAGFVQTAIALLLALGALHLFSRLCRRLIGGHTGDTLGACQQIVEIMLLTGLALGISNPT